MSTTDIVLLIAGGLVLGLGGLWILGACLALRQVNRLHGLVADAIKKDLSR